MYFHPAHPRGCLSAYMYGSVQPDQFCAGSAGRPAVAVVKLRRAQQTIWPRVLVFARIPGFRKLSDELSAGPGRRCSLLVRYNVAHSSREPTAPARLYLYFVYRHHRWCLADSRGYHGFYIVLRTGQGVMSPALHLGVLPSSLYPSLVIVSSSSYIRLATPSNTGLFALSSRAGERPKHFSRPGVSMRFEPW